jgi:hypothetical protein
MGDFNPWLSRTFDRHTPVREYLGLTKSLAERAAAEAGIKDVRVVVLDEQIRGNRVFHSDARTGRLNLAVVGGKVVRAAFF